MSDLLLEARSAFAGIFVSPAGSGVVATVREGLGIASVAARRGQQSALRERVAAHFGLALPNDARRVVAGALSATGSGPGTWLFTAEDLGNALIPTLKAAIGDTASIADQSDAYAILRLTGPKLRETLAKLVPLDFHPRAFKVGDSAATLAAHIGALLWRSEDGVTGDPVFELAVYRSMAASFWHDLSHHCPDLAA